jgi:hypothetical protein
MAPVKNWSKMRTSKQLKNGVYYWPKRGHAPTADAVIPALTTIIVDEITLSSAVADSLQGALAAGGVHVGKSS